MKPAFEYKGYLGSAEVSVEDNLVVGRLMYIRDVVSYVASEPRALEKAFQEAVDDYLATCKELGDDPDVPFKGSFNVRTGPERHRRAALAASCCDTSLNDWVCMAIDEKLNGHHDSITNHFTVHFFYGNEVTQHVTTAPGIPAWTTSRTVSGAAGSVRH
jgi:predicted HicB family RNase H-like nuclease